MLHIALGDVVPVDGVFISGHSVICDESAITGNSDPVKKTPGDIVMSRIEGGGCPDTLDPFIISGTKVLEGVGTYIVTSVGQHSRYGKLTMATISETTPVVIAGQQVLTLGVILLLLFVYSFSQVCPAIPSNPMTAAIENFRAQVRGRWL